MLCHWGPRCYVAVLFVMIHGVIEPMSVTDVVSQKSRCYKADVMVSGVEDQYVCHRCCATKKPAYYLTYLLELKLWWNHQHLIPYVWQLVFACIPIKGWVIISDKNDLFDRSCQIFLFSAHNVKIVNGHFMTSGVLMIMDGTFMCSFYLSANVLPVTPIYSSSQSTCHFLICISPHFSARWYLYPWVLLRGPW